MKRTRLISTVSLFLLLLVNMANAGITLPAIISSNMVLQRDAKVVLWGWADAQEEITIKVSWMINPLVVTADNQGNWHVELNTNLSKEPQSINFLSDESNITLENVLFGEVWLCSGQSNMQQPVKGYQGQPTFGSIMATATSANHNLRLFTVDRIGSKTPLKDVDSYTPWQEASPDNVADFSAIAYYFGQKLQEVLDVPVGMIHTSWGGSSVQAWISKEVMSTFQEVNLDDVDISKGTNHIPAALYNAMIHPLIPFTIKGALWYQGESNRMEPEKYRELFPAMVKDWRSRWGIGDFAFYYAQIAPYWYNNNEVYSTAENSAFIREIQLQCVDLIPNSGIAVTMDIGDEFCIHPPMKIEVADRLLFNALNQTYGLKSIDGKSPVYESMEVKDGGIVLSFKNAETGLFSFRELTGFEISGPDKVFYPATAKISGEKVIVKSDKVSDPKAVRYAWQNYIEGTLFDTNLLPASSFRTDNWSDAKRYNGQ